MQHESPKASTGNTPVYNTHHDPSLQQSSFFKGPQDDGPVAEPVPFFKKMNKPAPGAPVIQRVIDPADRDDIMQLSRDEVIQRIASPQKNETADEIATLWANRQPSDNPESEIAMLLEEAGKLKSLSRKNKKVEAEESAQATKRHKPGPDEPVADPFKSEGIPAPPEYGFEMVDDDFLAGVEELEQIAMSGSKATTASSFDPFINNNNNNSSSSSSSLSSASQSSSSALLPADDILNGLSGLEGKQHWQLDQIREKMIELRGAEQRLKEAADEIARRVEKNTRAKGAKTKEAKAKGKKAKEKPALAIQSTLKKKLQQTIRNETSTITGIKQDLARMGVRPGQQKKEEQPGKVTNLQIQGAYNALTTGPQLRFQQLFKTLFGQAIANLNNMSDTDKERLFSDLHILRQAVLDIESIRNTQQKRKAIEELPAKASALVRTGGTWLSETPLKALLTPRPQTLIEDFDVKMIDEHQVGEQAEAKVSINGATGEPSVSPMNAVKHLNRLYNHSDKDPDRFISAHLLTEKLGGKSSDNNLAPAKNKSNTGQLREAEKTGEQMVWSENKTLSYKANAHYTREGGPNAEREKDNSLIPGTITVTIQELEFDSRKGDDPGNWENYGPKAGSGAQIFPADPMKE